MITSAQSKFRNLHSALKADTTLTSIINDVVQTVVTLPPTDGVPLILSVRPLAIVLDEPRNGFKTRFWLKPERQQFGNRAKC